jgi:hypothetical protein
MEEFEIYVRDLNKKAQRELLKFMGLRTAQEGNLDVFPIATVPKPESK